MINPWKKYIIMILQLPLTLIGICVKLPVAIITFIYIRWIRKGIHQGNKLHNYIETQELGYRKPKGKK